MKLSLTLLELLAISLGVDRMYYRKFFQDSLSIMRCNFYPACQDPEVTLGTGPHCDPTSITILHQDHVVGLNVFSNNVWQTVRPRHGAFVINIGDTFTVGLHLHEWFFCFCFVRYSYVWFCWCIIRKRKSIWIIELVQVITFIFLEKGWNSNCSQEKNDLTIIIYWHL